MTRVYSSDAVDQLATALAVVQGKLEHATKAADNPFFKSKYADLPAVYDVSREALAANGLSVTQLTDFDEQGTVLVTTLLHKSGQWMRGYYPIRPVKPDPQSVGSAITYGRRYAYSAMVGVAAIGEDDDGNAASATNRIQGNDGTEKNPYGTAKARTEKYNELMKALQTSDDPAGYWHDNLRDFEYFKAFDTEYYSRLTAAGKKRREELLNQGGLHGVQG